METIRYLLSRLIIIVPLIAVIIFLYWLATLALPYIPSSPFSTTTVDGKVVKKDWLPAPGSWGLLKPADPPKLTTTVYDTTSQDGQSPGVSYVMYQPDGTMIITNGKKSATPTPNTLTSTSTVFSSTAGGYTNDGLYVRNLSVYKGGGIYTGISFTGEARGTMFTKGAFPLYIIDSTGRLLGTAGAYATETWAVPGWVRFQAQINTVLPVRTPCAIIFAAAPGSVALASKPQIRIPFTCNP